MKLGLKRDYQNNQEVTHIVKCAFALPLLKPEMMEDGIEVLKQMQEQFEISPSKEKVIHATRVLV